MGKLPGQQQPGIKKSVVGWVKGSDGEAILKQKVRVVTAEGAEDGKESSQRPGQRIQHEHTVPIKLQIGNQTGRRVRSLRLLTQVR